MMLHAEVVALSGEDATKVQVRTSPDEGPSPCRWALLSQYVPYRPSLGDRVIVAAVGDDLCILGVVAAANPPEIGLSDGGAMRVRDGAAEVVDREGRVVVRYANGALEIAAPSGDLTLAAPSGRVTLRSAEDIHLDAVRDITHSAGRSVETTAGTAGTKTRLRVGHAGTEVETKRLRVRARSSALTTDEATLVAGRISTTAVRLTQESSSSSSRRSASSKRPATSFATPPTSRRRASGERARSSRASMRSAHGARPSRPKRRRAWTAAGSSSGEGVTTDRCGIGRDPGLCARAIDRAAPRAAELTRCRGDTAGGAAQGAFEHVNRRYADGLLDGLDLLAHRRHRHRVRRVEGLRDLGVEIEGCARRARQHGDREHVEQPTHVERRGVQQERLGQAERQDAVRRLAADEQVAHERRDVLAPLRSGGSAI